MGKRGGFRWNPVGNKNPAWKDGLIKDGAWVRRAYVDRGLSIRQVAKEAACSVRTAARWIRIHGIETRSMKEAAALRDTSGEKSPNWKGGAKRCCCGNKKSSQSFRCAPCAFADRSGSANSNWKGFADVKVLLRSYLREQWSPKILERDGFRCRGCGDDSGGNLNAHHITRLAVIMDRVLEGVPRSTTMERVKAFFVLVDHPSVLDLDNGVTLCDGCHRKIHYGPFKDECPLSLLEKGS